MQLKDLEEEYEESLKNIGDEEKKIYIPNGEMETLNENYNDLKYNNDYGGFTENGL